MVDPFATALAALHGSVVAVDAIYNGAPDPIRVIRSQPTVELPINQGAILADSDTVSIQKSDVALPAIGDTLVIASEALEIIAEPRLDTEGLSWCCEIGLA